jgi:hypothetical protein
MNSPKVKKSPTRRTIAFERPNKDFTASDSRVHIPSDIFILFATGSSAIYERGYPGEILFFRNSHGTRSDSQLDESLRIYVYVRDVPR